MADALVEDVNTAPPACPSNKTDARGAYAVWWAIRDSGRRAVPNGLMGGTVAYAMVASMASETA